MDVLQSQIKTRISQFLWRGESLLRDIEISINQSINQNELADDTRVKLAGEIVGALDIGLKCFTTKHTRALLKKKRDEENRQRLVQVSSNVSYWISEMESYFENISI
ncbi:MAG: hypothetical protein ACTSW1_09630 [Candidatus Hodarchaeales archaeon]